MLPDLKLSLVSPLNKADCISKLDSNLCQWSPYLGEKKKIFMGERYNDEFKFCQTRQHGNSFHPIAIGNFYENEGKTKISVSFRMHMMVTLFLSIFFIFSLLAVINVLLSLDIRGLPLLLLLSVPFGLVYVGFYCQVPKFKNRIAKVLESELEIG